MSNVRLEDIVERLQSNNPEADVDLVRRAYIFSAKAHQGQTRMSGESYLIHPLDVAKILSELRLDPATVAAGILHDTIEDTTSTLEEIRALFGEEVAKLVDGMTKLSRMELQSREEREAQNFRKMIVAMSNDIRVILIKLADRLHNMRTLSFLSPGNRSAPPRRPWTSMRPSRTAWESPRSRPSSRTSRSGTSIPKSTAISRTGCPRSAWSGRPT